MAQITVRDLAGKVPAVPYELSPKEKSDKAKLKKEAEKEQEVKAPEEEKPEEDKAKGKGNTSSRVTPINK